MTTITPVSIAAVLTFIGLDRTYRYAPRGGPVTVIEAHDLFTAQPGLLRAAIVAGMYGKLGNVSKASVSTALDRDATDADLAKARAAIVSNWAATGNWNVRAESYDSMEGDMRSAFYIKKGANDEAARRKLDKEMKALVQATFGKDEAARFGTFLKAVARTLAKDRTAKGGDVEATYADLLGKLLAKYEAAAEALRAERSKSVATLDVANLI